MMVGHCQSQSHRHHHPHYIHRSVSETSRDEQFPSGGGSSSASNNGSSSDYSLAMSSEVGERSTLHQSTSSLLDNIERRTQRTYRYGIGLVCIGATLNWLGFAQGTTYHIDPLRYLGVACVLTGSFCVCISMCRWLGRPISVSSHHVTSHLEEERSNGDVHVINVAVPMYVPSLQEEYRPTKPPDYEQIVTGEPPPYDEAIKLSPGAFFELPTPVGGVGGISVEVGGHLYTPRLTSSSHCQTSPSHNHSHSTATGDLTRALLLDHDHQDSMSNCEANIVQAEMDDRMPIPPSNLTPRRILPILGRSDTEGSDPPPAYEPSPRPSISSCSSSTPLIPTSTARFELPPSFSVRRMFGAVSSSRLSESPNGSPVRRREQQHLANHLNEHLQEQVINEDAMFYAEPQQEEQRLSQTFIISSAPQPEQNSETNDQNTIANG